jgi:hypothetical protein
MVWQQDWTASLRFSGDWNGAFSADGLQRRRSARMVPGLQYRFHEWESDLLNFVPKVGTFEELEHGKGGLKRKKNGRNGTTKRFLLVVFGYGF